MSVELNKLRKNPEWAALFARELKCVYIMPAVEERSFEDAPCGSSKIGGYPDLPDSVEWPREVDEAGKERGKAPLVAQFNLAEIPAIPDMPLPGTGYLWIFEGRQDCYKPVMKVVYEPRPGKLKRRKPDHEFDALSTEVRFEAGISLPFGRTPHHWQFRDPQKCVDFWPLVEATFPRERFGQIGGYALDTHETQLDLYRRVALCRVAPEEVIDADMWESIESFNKDLEREGSDSLLEYRAKLRWILKLNREIEAEASRWRLLCDFTQLAKSRLDLGGYRHLSLFVQPTDLAEAAFENVFGQYRAW